MKKRKLKAEVAKLTDEVNTLKAELIAQENKNKRLETRLLRAGSLFKQGNVPGVKAVDLGEAKITKLFFGDYVSQYGKLETEQVERDKQKLAMTIAKGLLKENLLQIIEHDKGDGMVDSFGFPTCTVGVKICVVPWEETAVPTEADDVQHQRGKKDKGRA